MAQAAAGVHGAENGESDKRFWVLALGSLGVVYGDIGTSPLYALREAVTAATKHGASANTDAVLGILSLIVWTMFLIVTVLKPLVPSVPNFTRAVGPSRSVATSFCTE